MNSPTDSRLVWDVPFCAASTTLRLLSNYVDEGSSRGLREVYAGHRSCLRLDTGALRRQGLVRTELSAWTSCLLEIGISDEDKGLSGAQLPFGTSAIAQAMRDGLLLLADEGLMPVQPLFRSTSATKG